MRNSLHFIYETSMILKRIIVILQIVLYFKFGTLKNNYSSSCPSCRIRKVIVKNNVPKIINNLVDLIAYKVLLLVYKGLCVFLYLQYRLACPKTTGTGNAQ